MEFLAAFLLGLSSAPHCMAMCGGIASALMLGARQRPHDIVASDARSGSAMQDALLFGSGKMLGYMSLGLIAGLSGFLLGGIHQSVFGILRAVAGLLMILLGLYTAGWWMGLGKLEQAAFRLWQPVLSRARQINLGRNSNKLMAGILWGLLPCGIVYTVLAMALVSANMLTGLLIMLSFGLGTLPFVLAAGGLIQLSAPWLQQKWFRSVVGLILISFGISSLMMALR